MKVKIWGARGSIPAPLTSQAIHDKIIAALQGARNVDLSDPISVLAYVDGLPPLVGGTAGGNTSCVELQADDQTIIIDAGTGIRLLGQELMAGPCGRGQGVLHLFFSHTHWDHIQGLPFFDPAYVPGNRIYIYSVDDIALRLIDQMKPTVFPVPFHSMEAAIQFVPLTEGQALTLGNVRITNLRVPHRGGSYAYRFEHRGAVVVYATDAEYQHLDEAHLQPFVRFYAGADVLIFDAQFSLPESLIKADWGHSSPLIGLDMAQRAGVKRLILFHHDPNSSDADLTDILARTIAYQAAHGSQPSCEVMIASEGLTIDLAPPAPFSLHWSPPEEAATLVISGDFDQQAVTQVLRQVAEASRLIRTVTRSPRLVVDLSGVTRLTIPCLRALIDLQRQWQDRSMALASLSPQVQHVIELANYLDFFAIYSTVQEAQAALEAREVLCLPGQMLKERYRIEAKQGDSDLGTIFEATDTRLERRVTIKVLSPSLSQATTRRLLRKAQKLARLHSPNIVTLFDCDEDRGLAFLVMEHVGCQTLDRVMGQENQLPPLDIAAGILRALEYAHSNGIVHGNLTPASVLLESNIKLKDFELTWIEEGQPPAESPVSIGDPHYLAPEQIMRQGVDARTDLYALGVLLYELFTGHRPFVGSESEILDQHLHRLPTPPRQINPELSRSLEYLILKLLAKQPDQRYASATQVRRVLLGLEATVALPSLGELVAGGLTQRRQQTLVGRDAQLQDLLTQWASAQRGQGQVVMIAGEAGVGKTRLVEEVAARIRSLPTQAMVTVLFGHCTELEGNTPYQPFIEVVRNYLVCATLADLHQQLGDAAAVLAALVPEVRHLIPDMLPLAPLEPEQERLRLMHGFTRFVGRASAVRPWLLVLEDLHWSDPASLHLLHYLARYVATMPLLVIGTYRDVELDPRHPLHDLVRALGRSPTYHHVALDRLDQDAVRRMLEDIWHPGIPEEWVTAIYQHTGGNPFYVQEVAKGLADDGAIALQDGVWQFAPVVEVKLPQSVRDVVLRRMTHVRPATQDLLRRAAVLGQQFSFADLLAVSEQPEDLVLESLDEALGRYLIREVEAGTLLVFAHEEIRQVIYEDMSAPRRQALHRRVGLALERRAGRAANLAPIASELAQHFIQAGDREKGFTYSLQAAQHAHALYAPQAALTWYGRALSILPSPDDATSLPKQVELYEGLGEVLLWQTQFAKSAEAYETMETVAKTVGDVKAQVRAWNGLAQVRDRQGNYRAALESAGRAEQLARAVDAQVELVLALVMKGWALFRLGDGEPALDLAEEALAISTKLEAHREMALSLNLLGTVHDLLGHSEAAARCMEEALALCREMGDRVREDAMLNNMGENARLRGDYRTAIARYEEALAVAREIGDRDGEMVSLSNLGGAQVGLGEYQAAEATLRQAILMTEPGYQLSEVYCFLAGAYLGQGKAEDALAAARRALELASEQEEPQVLGAVWRVLGMVLDFGFRAERSDFGSRISDLGSGSIYDSQPPKEGGSAIRDPRACFAESLRLFTQINAKGERARTLRAWAQYEQNQGCPEDAQKMWQEARDIFTRLGMTREVERMADLPES